MDNGLHPSLFNLVYPVVAISKYPGGFVIHRKNQLQGGELYRTGGGKRGEITRLSTRSLARLALTAQSIPNGRLRSMLTLTYGVNYPNNGKVVKYQLRKLLQWLLRKFGRYSYVWFLEFQKRGAPHLHVLLSLEPSNARLKLIAGYWIKIQGLEDWPYSRLSDKRAFHVKQAALSVALHPSSWELLRSDQGAKRYITKYATKTRQKDVPAAFGDVGRFWGVSSDLRLGMPERVIDTTEEDLRCWLADVGHQVADWEVLPKIVLKFDKF